MIGGHPVQPGTESRIPAIILHPVEDLDEYLLQGIFSILRGSQHPPGEVVDFLSM
jgi:hypothetical protein